MASEIIARISQCARAMGNQAGHKCEPATIPRRSRHLCRKRSRQVSLHDFADDPVGQACIDLT